MRRFKSKRVPILEKTLGRLAATHFGRALRLVNRKSLADSDLQVNSGDLTKPYITYDELRRVRLQLLELERQRAQAIELTRRSTYS